MKITDRSLWQDQTQWPMFESLSLMKNHYSHKLREILWRNFDDIKRIINQTSPVPSLPDNDGKSKKIGYIATIQILIPQEDVDSESEACDWVHGLMDSSTAVDWGYIDSESPRVHVYGEEYEEGDMFQ